MTDTGEMLPWVGPHSTLLRQGWAAGSWTPDGAPAWQAPDGGYRWFTVVGCYQDGGRWLYPDRETAERRLASLRSRYVPCEARDRLTVAYVQGSAPAYWAAEPAG
jgi:hypothetical protein